MANIYVDGTNGDDTTGAGTSGNPYASISKAFTVVAAGDSIKVANTSVQSIGDLAMPSITTTLDAFLVIEGWDNGGSIIIENPAGDITDVCAIDGRFTGTLNFVKFHKIKFQDYNLGSNAVAPNGSAYIYDTCDFTGHTYSGAIVSLSNNGMIINCSFRNYTTNLGNAMPISNAGSNCLIENNFFYNCRKCYLTTGTQNVIKNNIFVSVGDHAISLAQADKVYIVNNTFIGDSTANHHAITFTSTNMEYANIFNNHFQDYTGSGAYAINAGAQTWPTTKGTFNIVGNNSFYNNTANYNTGGNFADCIMNDIRSLDITESAEPLEDKANYIYYKKTTATSYGNSVYIGGYNYTETLFNKTTGAAQNEIGAGGGGGGETSHVSG